MSRPYTKNRTLPLMLDGEGPDVLMRNEAITQVYAELYLSDPELFKWAGMAALASELVGSGIEKAVYAYAGLGTVGLLGTFGGLGFLGIGGPRGHVPGTDVDFLDFASLLATGNQLVFSDIAWQHVAYAHGGIDAIRQAHDAGELTRSEHASFSQDVLGAWARINRGERAGNQALVWSGNEELLFFEQSRTLQQGVYDQDRGLFKSLTSGAVGLFVKGPSPIPGYPGHEFRDAVPGGDLGDLNDRWEWIQGTLLPDWKRLEPQSGDEIRRLLRR